MLPTLRPLRRVIILILLAASLTGTMFELGPANAQQNPFDVGEWFKRIGEQRKDAAERARQNAERVAEAKKRAEERRQRELEEKRERERRARMPDAIDQLLLSSSSVRRTLERIDEAVKEGRYEIASEALLEFLGSSADERLWNEEQQAADSARVVARRMLANLPADTRRRLTEQLVPEATAALDEARRSGDLSRLVRIADRYLLTPAGQQAAVEWAQSQLDAGRLHTVLRWRDQWLSLGDAIAPSVERTLNRLGKAAEAQLARSRPAEPLDRRWVAGGSASGLSSGEAEPPLSLPQWQSSVILPGGVRQQIKDIEFEIDSSGIPNLPLAEPLLVGDRVVWRDLTGLHAMRLTDGSQPSGQSAVAGRWSRTLDDAYSAAIGQAGTEALLSPQNTNPSNAPVATLLYRDGVYNHISSDGRYVFVVVDESRYDPLMATNSERRRFVRERDADSSFDVNRLQAWDVKSGQLVWELGGLETGDTFDLPLAGTFFVGPPIAFEDRLFGVIERDGELSLQAIVARTGEPLWSRTLVTAPEAIGSSLMRRRWSATPSIAAGLVICQTHVGWVVAIDHQTGQTAWTHRLLPKNESVARAMHRYAMQRSLGSNWRQQRPVIDGDTVFVLALEHRYFNASPNEPTLHALDLKTGRLRWFATGANYRGSVAPVGLCDVHEGKPILFGANGVVMLEPPDAAETPLEGPADPSLFLNYSGERAGRIAWKFALSSGNHLSGTPVRIDDDLYLPLMGDRLAKLPIEGTLLGEASHENTHDWVGQVPLGTLITAGDRVVSQSPLGIAVLSRQADLTSGEGAAIASSSDFVRAVQVPLASGDFDTVAEVLATLPDHAALLDRSAIDVAINGLSKLRENGRQIPLDAIETLAEQVDTPDQSLAIVRLRVVQQADPATRAAELLRLLDEPTLLTATVSVGQTQVRGRTWLAASLRELWNELDQTNRATVADRVQRRITETMGLPEALVIAESRIADAELLAVARSWLDLNRVLDARQLARQLRASGDHVMARETETTERLDAAMAVELEAIRRQFGEASATSLARSIRRRSRRLTDDANDNANDAASGTASEQAATIGPSWPASPSMRQLSRSARGAIRKPKYVRSFDAIPALAKLSFDGEMTDGLLRIYVTDRTEARTVADFGLSLLGSTSRLGANATLEVYDDELFAVTSDRVERIDSQTFQTQWTASLPRSASSREHDRDDSDLVVQEFDGADDISDAIVGSRIDSLVVGASRTRLFCRGIRDLTAVDRATGQIAWTRPIGRNVNVRALASGVLMNWIADGRWQFVLLDERDGSEHAISSGSYARISASVGIGDGLTTFGRQSKPGASSRTWPAFIKRLELQKSLYNTRKPLKFVSTWEVEEPAESQVAYFEGGTGSPLLVLADGAVRQVDLVSGRSLASKPVRAFQNLAARVDIKVLRDASAYYLVPEAGSYGQSGYISNVDTERVGGSIAAVSRTTGKLLWTTPIPTMMLSISQLQAAPFVTLIRTSEETHESHSVISLRLQLIDKRTGERIYADSRLIGMSRTSSSRLSGIVYDGDEPNLSLLFDGRQYQFRPADGDGE